MRFKQGQRVIRRGTVKRSHANLVQILWDGEPSETGNYYFDQLDGIEPVDEAPEGTVDNDMRWQALQSDLKREILEEVAEAWRGSEYGADRGGESFSYELRKRAKRI